MVTEVETLKKLEDADAPVVHQSFRISFKRLFFWQENHSLDNVHELGLCFSGESNDEEREPLLTASVEHEQQKISVQCVDDPEPMKPMVHYEDETFPMYHHPPVEAEGENLKSKFLLLNKV
ncbi:hypothetical protein HF521_005745 [Silurus meridionalis]|uniref:Uncharacterized protein n=1 Tax=Silurus meridionalis TaxID=175797 RepID=A0A8T0AVI8_SILME|nr:hypothetical protein HF521_005745 [Silurus meridionalis]